MHICAVSRTRAITYYSSRTVLSAANAIYVEAMNAAMARPSASPASSWRK
jgi:hypothetical protein